MSEKEETDVVGLVEILQGIAVLTSKETVGATCSVLDNAQVLRPILWMLREIGIRGADVVGILELLASNLRSGEVDAEDLQRRLHEML